MRKRGKKNEKKEVGANQRLRGGPIRRIHVMRSVEGHIEKQN